MIDLYPHQDIVRINPPEVVKDRSVAKKVAYVLQGGASHATHAGSRARAVSAGPS